MPPEKWFDNFYFIGKPFVGAYILKTSAGLVVWDTLDNAKEAETMLVPGMKQLGLDPKDIKLVILTHGHFDHFGGAKYLQDTYHTPVAESQADWDLMAAYKGDGSDAHPYPPTKDRVLADGEDVKVGDATIHILLTPGHSPGTVSSIVPVKDHGKTIMMAMWGGTAYPGTKVALNQMGDSMDKFKAAVAKYNATGFLNTHPRAFYLRERLAAHDPKAPNPIVIGNADTQASVGVMRECLENMKDWYGAMGKD
jgi:metallo-beta-lactamase class B